LIFSSIANIIAPTNDTAIAKGIKMVVSLRIG